MNFDSRWEDFILKGRLDLWSNGDKMLAEAFYYYGMLDAQNKMILSIQSGDNDGITRQPAERST